MKIGMSIGTVTTALDNKLDVDRFVIVMGPQDLLDHWIHKRKDAPPPIQYSPSCCCAKENGEKVRNLHAPIPSPTEMARVKQTLGLFQILNSEHTQSDLIIRCSGCRD